MEQKDFMSMGFACDSRAAFTAKVPENTHRLKAESLVETGIEVIPRLAVGSVVAAVGRDSPGVIKSGVFNERGSTEAPS
jgi:hypothetical protein